MYLLNILHFLIVSKLGMRKTTYALKSLLTRIELCLNSKNNQNKSIGAHSMLFLNRKIQATAPLTTQLPQLKQLKPNLQ